MSASARPSWPVIGDGYQADLHVTDAHLWLFAEVYCLGYLAVVFDVNHKLKVVMQDASDLEDAKKKAEGYAAGISAIWAPATCPTYIGDRTRAIAPPGFAASRGLTKRRPQA